MRSASPAWREPRVVRIGVSSCLLGHEVRWDGGHKRDRFLSDVLARFVEWVPVCPELELGMGVPREPVHLTCRAGELHMVGSQSGVDWTERMTAFARKRAREIEALDLSGFVLKSGSPSCGMERVKVRTRAGRVRRTGRGLFAAALTLRLRTLPIEEEARLDDARLRENWIERLFAYRRLRSLFETRWRVGDLVAFHAAHELQLLSHAPESFRRLGRLLAHARTTPRAALRETYATEFMAALAQRATRRRHAVVLERCAGALRDGLDAGARSSLASLVRDYRAGKVPLLVPITLLRHYAQGLGAEHLAQQVYLDPHPSELMLRNRA